MPELQFEQAEFICFLFSKTFDQISLETLIEYKCQCEILRKIRKN